MPIEAICVIGGDTTITNGNWKDVKGQEVWKSAPVLDSATEVRARCVKPRQCPIRDKCTGKVTATSPVDNQFSKAIIHRIVIKDLSTLEDL